MTSNQVSPSSVEPVHWSVPGRVRVRISGLYRNPPAIDRFLGQVRHDRAILSAKVNPRTGNVLVLYSENQPLAEVIARLTRAANGQAEIADNIAWHALPAAEAASRLASDPAGGLSVGEARQRLATYGPNRLSETRRRSFAAILAGQLVSLPVLLLTGSAIASLVTGGAFEAVAILVVVAANGLIGAASEAQADKMIARLERQHRRIAMVRRGGLPLTIDADKVVPGDIIELMPGHFVPADGRLIDDRGLSVDEAILTGESLPVAKQADLAMNELCPLADRENMIWRGTLIAAGYGRAMVVATGRDTEVGRIQAMIGELTAPETPLQARLNRLGRQLVIGAVVLCAFLTVLGLARGFSLATLLRTVFALGVAAIPEGLPTVATLSLAQAVGVLKRKGVLIRRLEAVETLGVVSTVFFDKTGTLTMNRMSVAERAADGDEDRLWRMAALCSDTTVERAADGSWRLDGSPTECALVEAAIEHGIDVPALRRAMPRLSERYRDERRQSMATVHDIGNSRRLLAIKGSPPEVLSSCALSAEQRDAISARNDAMASRGLRVLAFACHESGADDPEPENHDLQWVGLAGLADPPRPGTTEFLADLRTHGLECIMLTGDQAPTACAVAKQLGMVPDGECPMADAAMVDSLPAAELAATAAGTRVFARIQPRHKLKVVEAFRQNGRVVSMVGDGVNDGPALKAADIGVTLGRHGSGAARDLSDVVLENDDLAGLVEAVEQGRLTHANIRKSVDFLVATNLSEMLLMMVSTALGMSGALNPLQLLWINLITDVLPGLALAREPPERGELGHLPAGGNGPFLDRAETLRIGGSAATMAASSLAVFAWARQGGDSLRASSLATTSLVTSQMLYAFTSRSRRRWGGGPNRSLNWAIGATLGVHLGALALPAARRLLGLGPLGPVDLAAAALSGLASFLANELRKPVK